MQKSYTTTTLLALLFLSIASPWHHSKAAENHDTASEELLEEIEQKIDNNLPEQLEKLQTGINKNQVILTQIYASMIRMASWLLSYHMALELIDNNNVNLTSLNIPIWDIQIDSTESSLFMKKENKDMPTWFIESFKNKAKLEDKKKEGKGNKEWEQLCDDWYTFYKKFIEDKKTLNNTHYPYLWLYKKIFEKAWYYIDVEWGLWLNEEESAKLLTRIAEDKHLTLPDSIVQEILSFSDMITYYNQSTTPFIKKATANLTTYAYWDHLYQGHLIPYLLIMVPAAIQNIEIEALFTWYNSFLHANPNWGMPNPYSKESGNIQLAHLLKAAIAAHLKSKPQYIAQWIKYTTHKQGHQAEVFSVAYAYKGDRIASGSGDQSLSIWDGKTGTLHQQCQVAKNPKPEYAQKIYDVAWAHKDDRIASASSYDQVCVWDAKEGTKLTTFTDSDYYPVYKLDWSHDDDYLVIGAHRTVRTLNLNNNEQTLFKGHSNIICGVSSSSNEQNNFFASASRDGTIRIWDPNNEKKEVAIIRHSKEASRDFDTNLIIRRVHWAHHKQDKVCENFLLASAGEDKKVYIWCWNQKTNKVTPAHVFEGHTKTIYSIAWSHDDAYIASAGDDRLIIIWDIKKKEKSKMLHGHTKTVSSLSFSHDDSHLVSGGDDKTIRIWDTKTGQQLHIIQAVDPRIANPLSHPMILGNKDLLHNIQIPPHDFMALLDKISTEDKQTQPFIKKCIATQQQLRENLLITFCHKIIEEEKPQKANEAQDQQNYNKSHPPVISHLLSPALILAWVAQAIHNSQQKDMLTLVINAITQKPDAFFGDQVNSSLKNLKALLSQRKAQGKKPNHKVPTHPHHISQSPADVQQKAQPSAPKAQPQPPPQNHNLNHSDITETELDKLIQKVETAENKPPNKYLKFFATHKISTSMISLALIGLLYILYNTFLAKKIDQLLYQLLAYC